MPLMTQSAPTPLNVRLPRKDGSRVPYAYFTSPEIYALEQERIFRGPTWSFLGLEVEIPNPGDFKSTFIGDTPVVMTRAEDGEIVSWVNKCAHRGAILCRQPKGNALSHTCVYHQWNYGTNGDLQGVPFRRGQKTMAGMPKDFDLKDHGLQTLRTSVYKGLVFATFSDKSEDLLSYLGEEMLPYIDRIFCKPIVYLGCTRQTSNANWKVYMENVKDPYHASLLHLFLTTFNIFRVGNQGRSLPEKRGLHSVVVDMKSDVGSGSYESQKISYESQKIRAYDDNFKLEDASMLKLVPEYSDAVTTIHVQPIFPQLVIQQIHNSLVARQVIPKGPSAFELIFHYFGYEDDTEELRNLRIMQTNLAGPAGYISMEDTEAAELVQDGIRAEPSDSSSVLDMSRDAPDDEATTISESMVRRFWVAYERLLSGSALNAGVSAR